MSLNIVVTHVAEHAAPPDTGAADRLRERLTTANNRWDNVCKSAAGIQNRLQIALMQVLVSIQNLDNESTFDANLKCLSMLQYLYLE